MPPKAPSRCGIDSVEIARIDRLLRETPADDLRKLWSATELQDAGDGPGRAASLAARFAAKEACLKLFPREAALNTLVATDFGVTRDAFGAPEVDTSPAAQAVMQRHRITRIGLSLTHDRATASAVALGEYEPVAAPLVGKLFYHLLPMRRSVILANLRLVFGDTLPEADIVRLAQAHYLHLLRVYAGFFLFLLVPQKRRASRVRVENNQGIDAVLATGKGVIVVTGHFGSWEVSTTAALAAFPHMRGRIHFVRRPIKPRWLDKLVNWHFRDAGFGIVAKRGGLDDIVEQLERGDVVVFPFDQHAKGRDGIPVEFFGHPARTFKSVAVIALATRAPVLAAASWREPDGSHVLRFEDPMPLIEDDDTSQAIRRNTRAYNAMLEQLVLRHPEQWYWAHRRWKDPGTERPARAQAA
ncbi:MAG TPA: 4'-phosphopantetheinyl transferase superfamily protein [Casimicrobiaceae bacterium]|nr:4'-phosphopantetheinyl transferase superfamily protein [Casimicrobiaceae bacterium]